MPTRRNLGPIPKSHLVKGGTWPEGPLKCDAPDAAKFVIEIARRLESACESTSQRAVAAAAKIDPKTVNNIIRGTTWAEVPTIFQLEQSLQTHLWPTYHITAEQPPNPTRQATAEHPDPAAAQWWKQPKHRNP